MLPMEKFFLSYLCIKPCILLRNLLCFKIFVNCFVDTMYLTNDILSRDDSLIQRWLPLYPYNIERYVVGEKSVATLSALRYSFYPFLADW